LRKTLLHFLIVGSTQIHSKKERNLPFIDLFREDTILSTRQ